MSREIVKLLSIKLMDDTSCEGYPCHYWDGLLLKHTGNGHACGLSHKPTGNLEKPERPGSCKENDIDLDYPGPYGGVRRCPNGTR